MDGLPTNNTTDFSDIPALGDEQGLNTFMQNQALIAQGVTPVQPAPAAQPQAQAAAGNQGATVVPPTTQGVVAGQPAPQAAQGTIPPAAAAQGQPGGLQIQGIDPNNITRNDVQQIMAGINNVNRQLAAGRPQAPAQSGYTAQETAFIQDALSKGYSLPQIQSVIAQRRAQAMGGANTQIEQRMAALENYLKTQEYQNAQNAFIEKLTEFGNKFGLSEQDLVTFGQTAMTKGINIAMPNVDMETVFRAVYPEQYSIRKQRMTPTNSSQIYGGTSIPEGNRAQASRIEDAYVDAFLAKAMPNQFQMNKK